MHCFLSGKPSPCRAGWGTHVHSARSVPCVYMHRTRPCQLLGKLSKSCQRPLSACVRVLQRIAWACQGREVHLQACCAQCSVCFHAHALPAPGGTHPQGSLGRRDPLRTAARIHSLCTQTDVVRRQDSRSHVGPICRGLWMRRESYGLPVREGAASVFP